MNKFRVSKKNINMICIFLYMLFIYLHNTLNRKYIVLKKEQIKHRIFG